MSDNHYPLNRIARVCFSCILKHEPGYVSTNLHQSLQPDATYQLVNVAEWESAKAFKSASQKMKDYFRSEKINMVEGLKNDPALYRVIRK